MECLLCLFKVRTGKDDGKVSVASTQVRGMKDHRVVHVTHPYIMKKKQVIQLTLRFLSTGSFSGANLE